MCNIRNWIYRKNAETVRFGYGSVPVIFVDTVLSSHPREAKDIAVEGRWLFN